MDSSADCGIRLISLITVHPDDNLIARFDPVVVGVNRYQTDQSARPTTMRVPKEVVQRQKERVRRVRRERSGDAVERALGRLRRAAGGDENLMPHIIEAVKAYATIGEICDTFRAVFGVHKPTVSV